MLFFARSSALVGLCTVLSVPALAIPFGVTSLNITNSQGGLIVLNGNTPDVTISGTVTDAGGQQGWNIAAELCVDGFCGGGNGSGGDPRFVRLTNVTISCTVGQTCAAPSAFFLNFAGTGLGVTIGAPLGVTESAVGTITGTGTATGAFHLAAFSGGPNAVLDLNFGPVGSGFNLGPVSGSTTTSAAGFGFNGFFEIDQVSIGSSILMSNSLDIHFENAPEPATVTLLGVGLLTMGLVRGRRRKRSI